MTLDGLAEFPHASCFTTCVCLSWQEILTETLRVFGLCQKKFSLSPMLVCSAAKGLKTAVITVAAQKDY